MARVLYILNQWVILSTAMQPTALVVESQVLMMKVPLAVVLDFMMKYIQLHTLLVSQLKATGIKSSYSTTDASIWISGFGGEFGYNEDYQPGLVDEHMSL